MINNDYLYRSRGQRGRRLPSRVVETNTTYVARSTHQPLSHPRSMRAIILVPCPPKLTHPLRVCLWNTVDSVEKNNTNVAHDHVAVASAHP